MERSTCGSLYKSYKLTEEYTNIEFYHDTSSHIEEENVTVTTYAILHNGRTEIKKDRYRFQIEGPSADEYRWTEFIDHVKFVNIDESQAGEERWRTERTLTYLGMEETEVLSVTLPAKSCSPLQIPRTISLAFHNPGQDIHDEVSMFENAMLRAHNRLRRKHGSKPLTLNKELSNMADRWARHLLATNQFCHSPLEVRQHDGKPCGENLTRVKAYSKTAVSGVNATNGWYAEISNYDFASPRFQKGTGHFSQLVWRDTREIGVAMVNKKEGHIWTIIVAANYFPSGNIEGQFSHNVSRATD